MGYVMLGGDRLDAPDLIVATLVDSIGRLLRAGCLPFVLSFDGPRGRHSLFVTAQSQLEMVVADRGPVLPIAATVDAIVQTTLRTGVLVLDLADLDELDIDLMRSEDP